MQAVQNIACWVLLAALAGACGTDDEAPSDAGLDGGTDSAVPGLDSAVPTIDAGKDAAMVEDTGVPEEDSSVAVGPTLTPKEQGLCTADYAKAKLTSDNTIRGTWQFNPGGVYVDLPESGYPCAAFKYDDAVRPALTDPNWTEATDGQFIGFSEVSTITGSGYMQVQFRYFRSLVFVPKDAVFTTFTVNANGIDDSLHVVLYNSDHPDGFSPTDVAPSDATVGACQGNGSANWDFAKYVKKGEVNVFMLVHADQSPSTSSLTSVDIQADATSVTTFDCTGIE